MPAFSVDWFSLKKNGDCVWVGGCVRRPILPTLPGFLPTFFGLVLNGGWNSTSLRFISTNYLKFYQPAAYFYQPSP
jgi:hypothetical protein